MTAEIVNMRRARKARARADKEKLAAENRATFGASGKEREARAAEKAIEERRLDGVKREGGGTQTGEDQGEGGA